MKKNVVKCMTAKFKTSFFLPFKYTHWIYKVLMNDWITCRLKSQTCSVGYLITWQMLMWRLSSIRGKKRICGHLWILTQIYVRIWGKAALCFAECRIQNVSSSEINEWLTKTVTFHIVKLEIRWSKQMCTVGHVLLFWKTFDCHWFKSRFKQKTPFK